MGRLLPVAGAAILLGLLEARASIVFNLNSVYAGDTPLPTSGLNSTISPWLRATIAQDEDGKSVDLTMTVLNLTGNENAVSWGFNLRSPLTGNNLTVSNPFDKSGAFTSPSYQVATSGPQWLSPATGLEFRWDFTTGGTLNKTFSNGDSVTFRLTSNNQAYNGGIITPYDFLETSSVSGSTATYYTVAKIQNTSGPSGSSKIGAVAYVDTAPPSSVAVPEPSTCLAGAMLLIPFGVSALRALRVCRAV